MKELYIIWDDKFAKRVVEHLKKNPEKAEGIVGIDRVPSDVQVSSATFVDEVEENLPEDMPSSCDIILAIGVDMYIQTLPSVAEETGAEGVIVPIEDSNWYPLGILNQTKNRLEKMGVEVAYPRPFCSLQGRGRESIEEFIEDYEIGRPSLNIDLEDGKISNIEVKVGAPCGSTDTVAEEILGDSVSFESSDFLDLEGDISEAHHSHPCTGDMMEDPVLSETILHRAGYLVRKAVKEATGLDLDIEKEVETGEIRQECPKLCGDCIEACEKSGTNILEMEDNEIVVPDFEKCVGCRSCVKTCPIEVASKIVTKRDNLLLDSWEDAKLSN